MNRRSGSGTTRTIAAVALVASCALVVWAVVGCAPTTPEVAGSPVDSVERLLELRAERSTDASAYAEVLVDPQVALDFAASAEAEQEATTTPTPEWETPYESSRETTAASVVVVWIPDANHADWPVATVFEVQLLEGTWRAADAAPVASADEIPAPVE